ncbi:MAG: right-handed parallel beta-helix repeat-containing protein [Clostridia bacterium]|nr:right-handed parallel beta-helix repeat-containing protein [Clostridia bacterium]
MYKVDKIRVASFLFILLIFTSVFIKINDTTEATVLTKTDEKNEIVKINQGDDIQEKINGAKDGSYIVIASGEYIIDEPIVIQNKNDFTISGDKDVWILGSKVDFQIFMIKDSGNVVLKNIKACHKIDQETGNTKITPKRKGSVVDIENCKKVTLENCELEGCGVYGVYAVDTDRLNLFGCYLHDNSWKALGLFNKGNVTNAIIKDCTIVNNADFLEKEGTVNIQFEGTNVIRNNTFEDYKNKTK